MAGMRRTIASLLAFVTAGSLAVATPMSASAAAAATTGAISVSLTTDLGAPAKNMALYLGKRSGTGYALQYQLDASATGSFSESGILPGAYSVLVYDLASGSPYGYGDVVLASAGVSVGRTSSYSVRLKAPFAERRSAEAVDSNRRAAVQSLYDSVEPMLAKGAVTAARPASCVPGGTANQSRNETLRVLNVARSLTGLDSVAWSATYNARAERAAVMMAANKSLSHQPSTKWKCYDSTGADGASHSALASGVNGPASVLAYLDDPGSTNTAVGHRRGLLNPTVTTMGTGNSGAVTGGAQTNAIYVQGPVDATAVAPRYTSWPSPGYFPWQFEPAGRWSVSVSRSDVTFEAAKVTVTAVNGARKGQVLGVTRYANAPGMGLNTLSFQVRGLTGPSAAGETNYSVTVTGLRQRGVTLTERVSYTVRFFNA